MCAIFEDPSFLQLLRDSGKHDGLQMYSGCIIKHIEMCANMKILAYYDS